VDGQGLPPQDGPAIVAGGGGVDKQVPDTAIFGRMAQPNIRWYSISLDTLRGAGMFLVVLLLVVAAFFGYRNWESWALERQATSLVQESQDLEAQLLARGELAVYGDELATGREFLRQALAARDAGDVRTTVEEARRARDVLASILLNLEGKGDEGEARFITVHGNVEFRRAGTDDWEEARNRVGLRSGDRVRTNTNGSADIMFSDGTFYTVSPNSSIVITRPAGGGQGNEQTVEMEHGWINLTTSENAARVATPDAEARVSQDSEAFVTYEEQTRRGRIAAVRGAVEVTNGAGQTRSLDELEQVVQQGSLLSETRALPSRPQLMVPPDKREIDGDAREVTLSWQAVSGATGYTLQVSRNKLFTNNIIDDTGRRKTSARLGIRGDGNFMWRVAAEGREQELGPWSNTRNFRIPSHKSAESGEDQTPPELTIESASGYGSIFIVEGKTEAGASVVVNGESVKVNADGSFTKTIQLAGEGWSVIEVRAQDAWGNAVDRRRRVFIDGSP